jgi:hypothetical protein
MTKDRGLNSQALKSCLKVLHVLAPLLCASKIISARCQWKSEVVALHQIEIEILGKDRLIEIEAIPAKNCPSLVFMTA